MRRTIINNTSGAVTRSRVGIVDITTLNTPGYVPGGPQADVRALSSNDTTVAVSDAIAVLTGDNQCSRAFGFWFDKAGQAIRRDVTEVVQALGTVLRPGIISPTNRTTGIRLGPRFSDVVNAQTGLKYRLPVTGQAVVNRLGPFYNSGRIGTFQSTSRAGRALAVLHEVAHLIWMGSFNDSRRSGRVVNIFLIPPYEGQRETDEMSVGNTRMIENVCGDQLRGLN